ncbi:hypothetical protein ACFL35_19930 [Candidatus Riflebacteria bacterium]
MVKKGVIFLLFFCFLVTDVFSADGALTHGYIRLIGKEEAKVKATGESVTDKIANQWEDGSLLYTTFFKKGLIFKKYGWVGVFKGEEEAVKSLVLSGDWQADLIKELHIYIDYESKIEEKDHNGNIITKPQSTTIRIRFFENPAELDQGVEYFKNATWGSLWDWLRKKYYYEWYKHYKGSHQDVSIHLYDGDKKRGTRIVSRYF